MVDAIKSVAAAATVIAAVVSYLTPWSVKVTPAPANVAAGDGGIVDAAVNEGPGGIDYPASITDCAGSFSPPLTLPSLSAAKADAVWALAGAIRADGDTNVKLDEHGKSTIDYKTNSNQNPASSSPSSTASCSGGSSPSQTSSSSGNSGTATITITRPGIDELKTLINTMISSGLGVAGSVAGGIVKAIVAPLLSAALSPLEDLLKVTGTGYVTVNSKSSTSSTSLTTPTTNAASCAPCLVGAWTMTNETNSGNPLLGGFSGGAGMKLTISSDGKFIEDWDGSAALTNSGGGSLSYTGVEAGSVQLPTDATVTSGPFVFSNLSGGVSADFNGRVTSVAAAGSEPGTYNCQGNTLSLTVPDGGGGTNHSTFTDSGS